MNSPAGAFNQQEILHFISSKTRQEEKTMSMTPEEIDKIHTRARNDERGILGWSAGVSDASQFRRGMGRG